MQMRSAALLSRFSASTIRFRSTHRSKMFYRPAPVRLPRSFISNLRTRSFQSGSNAPKFRPYVFIPIHTPLLNVACTGRLYLITQLFFIPVTTNASSAPDIQGAFLLPHAVRKDFFLGVDPSREFEIAWIGQTSGEFYKTRAQMAAETCAGISHQRLVALVLRRRGCQRLSPFANCCQYRPRRFSPGRKSPRLRGPCLRHPASHLNAHGARPARLSTRRSLRGLLRSRAGLLSWRNL